MPIFIVEAESPAKTKKDEKVQSLKNEFLNHFKDTSSVGDQVIIGGAAGALAAYARNAVGQAQAIAVVMTVAAIRVGEQLIKNIPKCDPELMKHNGSYLKKYLDQLFLFIKNNILLAGSYICGYLGTLKYMESS